MLTEFLVINPCQEDSRGQRCKSNSGHADSERHKTRWVNDSRASSGPQIALGILEGLTLTCLNLPVKGNRGMLNEWIFYCFVHLSTSG